MKALIAILVLCLSNHTFANQTLEDRTQAEKSPCGIFQGTFKAIKDRISMDSEINSWVFTQKTDSVKIDMHLDDGRVKSFETSREDDAQAYCARDKFIRIEMPSKVESVNEEGSIVEEEIIIAYDLSILREAPTLLFLSLFDEEDKLVRGTTLYRAEKP